MNPYYSGLPVVHLKTAELYISMEPEVITTVLGSCVSVIMYSPSGIGAICHGLLPKFTDCRDFCQACRLVANGERFKYLYCSIRYMVRGLHRLGIDSNDVGVKLFGGSDILDPGQQDRLPVNVGQRNIAIARKTIESEELRIVAADVGGRLGRKLFFYPHTGEVLMKRLKRSDVEAQETQPLPFGVIK